MLVRCCLSYVFKSAYRTVNPMEEEMQLLKLTNSLQQLTSQRPVVSGRVGRAPKMGTGFIVYSMSTMG